MVEESSRSSDPAVSSGLGFLRLVSVGILAWCLDLSHGDFGFSGSSCSRVSRSSRWSSRLWLFPFDSSVFPYCPFPLSGFVGQSSQHQRRLVCLRFLALCLNVLAPIVTGALSMQVQGFCSSVLDGSEWRECLVG
ncbi:unnamed protein product [Brassica rapa subsp. trilocularis]